MPRGRKKIKNFVFVPETKTISVDEKRYNYLVLENVGQKTTTGSGEARTPPLTQG
tara:strand:+ start:695 stop:859 length:165 start_codon:yes stop_codon:yes gene_type:complete